VNRGEPQLAVVCLQWQQRRGSSARHAFVGMT
jgi:hypothetical protein